MPSRPRSSIRTSGAQRHFVRAEYRIGAQIRLEQSFDFLAQLRVVPACLVEPLAARLGGELGDPIEEVPDLFGTSGGKGSSHC